MARIGLVNSGILVTAAFCACLSIQGCTTKGTPISVLGTPKFVPQSQPDSVVETGIGQDPNTGGIFLQWYATQGAAGFKVYRSDTVDANNNAVSFSVVENVASSSLSNDTSTVDVNSLVTKVKYYYYLRAYSADGSQGDPSDTIDYALLTRPGLHYPAANASVSSSGLVFSWIDRTGGGYTVIRVKDITVLPGEYTWVSQRHQIYGGSSSSEAFDFDSTATAQLISGHSYQWRVDRFDIDGTGRPYEGSRSAWGTFSVK